MQTKFKVILILILALAALAVIIFVEQRMRVLPREEYEPIATSTPENGAQSEPIEVVATNLQIPWDLAFLPGGEMLVTERPGNLVHINKSGAKTSIKLPRPVHGGEGGLLGLVLHPSFATNNLLYLYMTTGNSSSGTVNAVFRYKFANGELVDETPIIPDIPGALYHDGGRMEFGPDGYLYITTGDAQDENIAQNRFSLGGKILRLRDDGRVPTANPFGTAVYSMGHRNPQGLAWDSAGRLWQTEHGRSGVQSGYDEINLIIPGGNYGWPTIEGDETKQGMMSAVMHSGSSDTWAPASLVYLDGSLYFGGLRGEALYEAQLDGSTVTELKKYFLGEYGRIRTVRVGPDKMLYITTSNRDGRGTPTTLDDRIIRIDPTKL